MIEAGMLNNLSRLEIISNNLANGITPAFKRQQAETIGFEQIMGLDAPNNARFDSVIGTLPTVTARVDQSQGSLKHTGEPLDLAIEGDAWFVLEGADSPAYTRQGSFSINSKGMLVGPEGRSVLGEHGDITLTTMKPVIDSSGQVWENGNLVDRLQLVSPGYGANIERMGNALMRIRGDVTLVEADSTLIRQGYLESSNVTVMTEMVKMMELVRNFETSQKVLQGYDQMLDQTINVIGEF